MTNRPKLEKTIVLKTSPSPLLVIDFNVMCFAVLGWYESKIEGFFSKEVEKKLVRGAWALFVNRGPQFMKRHPYRIVFAADYRNPETNNYWRDDFMKESKVVQQAWVDYAAAGGVDVKELATHYKGTRSEKSEAFWFVYNEGRNYCQMYFPWFWRLGYEADDIAGSICRASHKGKPDEVVHKRQILLHTVDRDWTQLCDDENQIYFSNTRVCRPNEKIQEQLNGEIGVAEWAKHKMKVDIGHPSELAKHKAAAGDMCDNAVKGSPIELFDLCEPNPKWNIDKLLWGETFYSEVNNPEHNTRNDHYDQAVKAFAKICLEIPVST